MRHALAVLLVCLAAAPVQAAWPPPVPAEVTLTVREAGGVARTDEVARQGVPLPRSLDIRSTNGLAVVTGAGVPVPAQFRILARWHAALSDTAAPIQWVMVSFPATVAANGTSTYRLVTDGSVANPAPAQPLLLTQNGNEFTVDTGAAFFRFGGTAGSLFQEVRRGGTTLVSTSTMTGRINNTNTSHSVIRRVAIEEQGPVAAVVVVDGAYDLPAVGAVNGQGSGPGVISSRRRYVFTLGSPTAAVRHSVAWEGSLCSYEQNSCGGVTNGVRLSELQDALTISVGTSVPTITAVGAFGSAGLVAAVPQPATASVRQLLRANRAAALSFTATVPGTAGASGTKADGALLAASGPQGAVGIALDHMHRYEPQALRLLADGRLAVNLADGDAWLANHEGMFANLGVAALPSGVSQAELERLLWAPLNHPLRGFPSAQWFAASRAVDELPVGALPTNLAEYDPWVADVINFTLQEVDNRGLNGLMTFGLYPRTWGFAILGDELDCAGGGDDPTPGESFDNTFWCALWTDYHSTTVIAPNRVMRTGDVRLLDELSTPAALRQLHTQIIQCAPNDGFFYCGQAPSGYGGYRVDNNSSHQYFENLFLYYWFTGDSTVVETMLRGASTYRNYICPGRPGTTCGPDTPPTDEFAQVTGRVAGQFTTVFRLVGLTADVSYLEDYRSLLARAVTQYYVEPVQNAVAYGFWMDGPVTGPGANTTGQLWIASEFDMNSLYRWQVDTNDQAIGNPAITASRVQAAWARTLVQFGSTLLGNGSADGTWPNQIDFTWTGARLGGALTTVAATPGGGDPTLYDSNKPLLTAVIERAGDQTSNVTLQNMGRDLAIRGITVGHNAEFGPFSKIQAEYQVRTGSAVARLTPLTPNPPADATTGTATAVGTAGATLNGTVNPNGPATTVFFQYGTTTAYGTNTASQNLPAGTSAVPVSAAITGLTCGTSYQFRVVAQNANGTSEGANASFNTTACPAGAPTVTSPTSASVTASGATLGGNVTGDGGAAVTERGVVVSATSVNADPVIGGNGVTRTTTAGTTGVFTVAVSGLSASTGYSFKAYATNSVGTTYTSVATFSTAASGPPPTATTGAASAVGTTGATLNGTVNPNGLAATAFFQYGTTTAYGTNTASQSLGSGTTVVPVGAAITGLACGTTYQFRISAQNGNGSSDGANASFTTTACAPTVTSPTSAAVTATGATLGGNVTSDGGSAVTERGVVSSATSVNADPVIGGNGVTRTIAAGTTGVFTVAVGGLNASTGHSFKAYATNALGTTYTGVATFTTSAPGPSVSAGTTTATTNQSVAATVANGPANARDWVALAVAGSANTSLVTWQYLNGTQTPPASGVAGATLSFAMPATAGSYVFRFFANDGFTLLAQSATIVVSLPTTPVIGVSPPSVAYGNVAVNSIAEATVTVTNTGAGTLSGTASVGGAPFSVVSGGSYALGANQSQQVTVRYAPTAAVASSGALTLTGGGGASVPLSGTGVLAPAVAPSTTTAGTGQSVNAVVSNGPANARDWVALAVAGSGNTSYLSYRYLNGSTTPPTVGQSAATIPFTMPNTAGSYVFRFFANDGFTLLAQSAAVTVTAPTPTVTPSTTSASTGQSVNAVVGNGPANPADWLALAAAGAGNTSYLDWRYLNGAQTPPASGLSSATVSFTMPTTAGNYVFRFFANNGFTLLAQSAPIAVTVPTTPVLGVSPPSLAYGNVPVNSFSEATVTVTNTGGGTLTGTASVGGAPFSVVSGGSYSLGANQSQQVAVRFSPTAAAASSGALTLTGAGGASVPLSGTGVVGPSVTPSTTATTRGQPVDAVVANGPANPRDWVALASAGSALTSYLEYRYLNNSTTPPTAGQASATLPFTMPAFAGSFVFRFFANDGFTLLAQSAAIVVTVPTTPVIGLSPSSVAFGNVATSSFLDRTVTVTNTGSGTLTGTASTDGAPFSVVSGGSYALAALQSQQVVVRYAPTATVTSTGTLTLTGGGGASAPLSGTGIVAPAVSPSTTAASTGQSVNAVVSNGPANARDWIALAVAGSANTSYLTYRYLNGSTTPPTVGQSSATVAFTMPATAGSYVFRFFANDGFTLLAQSATIVVSAPTPTITAGATAAAPGQSVNAVVANGPANTRDWIGLALAGSANTSYLDWRYLNGAQTPPASGLSNATVSFVMPTTPGSYVFRLFANDGSTLLAQSQTVTVQ